MGGWVYKKCGDCGEVVDSNHFDYSTFTCFNCVDKEVKHNVEVRNLAYKQTSKLAYEKSRTRRELG